MIEFLPLPRISPPCFLCSWMMVAALADERRFLVVVVVGSIDQGVMFPSSTVFLLFSMIFLYNFFFFLPMIFFFFSCIFVALSSINFVSSLPQHYNFFLANFTIIFPFRFFENDNNEEKKGKRRKKREETFQKLLQHHFYKQFFSVFILSHKNGTLFFSFLVLFSFFLSFNLSNIFFSLFPSETFDSQKLFF